MQLGVVIAAATRHTATGYHGDVLCALISDGFERLLARGRSLFSALLLQSKMNLLRYADAVAGSRRRA
jgi:hypothetical protein